MSSIDITKLRNRWMGKWNPTVQYVTNDVVQWRGSSYVCIRDLPADQIIVADTSVSTNMYQSVPPTLTFKSIDPTDATYWLDMAPGMSFRRTWSPRTTYTTGDIVELGGDLYICIRGGVRNTYVTNSTYWTKIFENADRDQRYVVADFINQQPLGWTRNNGDVWFVGGNCNRAFGFIGVNGNVYIGGHPYRGTGVGGSLINSTGQSGYKTPCFSFVDWRVSTDNGGAGTFTTPDGQPPKCIQVAMGPGTDGSYGTGFFLFNNGELYATGYNAQGQLGVATGDTTTRDWPVRVTNTDLTDWYGNVIPKSFSQTKIIKVVQTAQGTWENSAPSIYCIGDDGTVWVWGYNTYGQLGLGPESTATNSVGAARTNQTKPQRMPQSYFDNKKIVDIMSCGGDYGWVLAIDEDGYMWSWGVNLRGGNGLADRHASTSDYGYGWNFNPVRINVDWNRNGGIKKIQMGGNIGDYEFTWVLDGNGYLWFAGDYNYNGQAQPYAVTATGDTAQRAAKFTRLDKNWYSEHKIENFWVMGNQDWNVIIREKGTGLTYIFGSNQEGQLGHANNHNYNNATWSPYPTAVRNVRYVKDAAQMDTGRTTSNTFMVVTDDGELWGKGTNSYGVLGTQWSGQSTYNVSETEDLASRNLWTRAMLPPGTTITGVYGFGYQSYDGGMFITDTGGFMISGWDGNDGYDIVQGHINTRAYRDTAGNAGSYHWYSLHSYPG